MAKTAIGDENEQPNNELSAKNKDALQLDVAVEVDTAFDDAAAVAEAPPVAAPWEALTVAIIDDAMHPPRLDRIPEGERQPLAELLFNNEEVLAELAQLGCPSAATADERLLAIAESEIILVSIALVGPISKDAQRMIEEHRSFRRLVQSLREEVNDITICDPYIALPDLSGHNLILLDYYLNGPTQSGELAVTTATNIRNQPSREPNQQIVLMSSLESVRDLRGQFRSDTELTGSAFAFISKRDLNETWKVKAHLGMLERARPYAPAFTDYREKLDEALAQARTELLAMVDDLDIGDYAFLQGRALMKDGHPLGDYVFWLLSSQLMTLAFEREEMRNRQRALDSLEFVGAPFAATEPSTVVANLLHSALVSSNLGPLGPHPRAKPGTPYFDFPLVQLGDVFLDADRTKAMVVMSADCDLAFAPLEDRPPDAETPVMLIPGAPVKLKDAKEGQNANTDGLLHREEVYRIVWEFSKYRSVPLGELSKWLEGKGFDISNRDRLRPLFALKLQQEFGAHLMRVGPPVIPPMTTKATGRVLICSPEQEEVAQFTSSEIRLTRFKKKTWLRITPNVAGLLKLHCEDLRARLEEMRAAATGKEASGLAKKIESLGKSLDDDEFWINLLDGVELNGTGSIKTVGPLGFVVGKDWADTKVRIMLEINEDASGGRTGDQGKVSGDVELNGEVDAGAVSTAV